MAATNRRKMRMRFWINPEIQGRFVVFYIIACAVLSLLLVTFLYGFVWKLVTMNFSTFSDVSPIQLFRDTLVQAFVMTGILFVICAFLGGMLLVFVSHRIAGPVYRINEMLESPLSKQPPSLRSGDALQDVYQKISALARKSAMTDEHYNKLLDIVEKLCGEAADNLSADFSDLPSLVSAREFLEQVKKDENDE